MGCAEAVAGTAEVDWVGVVLAAAGSIGCEADADGRGDSGEDAASTSGAEAGAIAEAGEDAAAVEADVAARSVAPEGADWGVPKRSHAPHAPKPTRAAKPSQVQRCEGLKAEGCVSTSGFSGGI